MLKYLLQYTHYVYVCEIGIVVLTKGIQSYVFLYKEMSSVRHISGSV